MRFQALVLSLLFLVCLSAFGADEFRTATAEELAMKDVPWAPGAHAVVLDWEVRYDDVSSKASEYLRIKVLREEGRKYGDVELMAIRHYHAVSDIKARTTRPDGTVTQFTGKVYDKVLLRKGGLRVTTRTFTLPNVEPGAILEYRYSTSWNLAEFRTGRWPVQREIPIRRASFWVRPAQMVQSLCVTRGLRAELAPKRVKDHFELELENMPPFIEEALAPPEGELKPRLEFFYMRESAEKYWEQMGQGYVKWLESYIGNRSAVKKAALETVKNADDETKLRLLYERVQALRNLSYETEKSEQESKREKLRDRNDIDDLLKLGYGSDDELNRLFVGLARAAGFEAWIVLVPSRDDTVFTREVPDASQFTDELAVVRVGTAERYYDPGTPYARPGQLMWPNTAVQAFALKPKTKGEWTLTPEHPYATSVTSRVADLHLDGDLLKGKVTITYRGQDALLQRLESRNEDEAANRKRFEDAAKAIFPEGSSVKLAKINGLADGTAPLALELDVELANLGAATGSRAILPLSVFASNQKTPFVPETRRYPVYFAYQRQTDDRVTLHLPDGFVVESLPNSVVADGGIVSYSSQWKQGDKTLSFERKMTVKKLVVPAAEYPRVRAFYSAMVAADQDAVVLKKATS
ncbi:MAG TPA: DUF3857 domain-containing protein [Thermoanaerobaculia bacterium]